MNYCILTAFPSQLIPLDLKPNSYYVTKKKHQYIIPINEDLKFVICTSIYIKYMTTAVSKDKNPDL